MFLKKADYDVGDHSVTKADLRKVMQGGGLEFYIKKEKDALKKAISPEKDCGQYEPVDEIHVNNNEYLPKIGESKVAFKPRLKTIGTEEGDNDSAEEPDEEFDWYDALACEKDSYFVMLN